ncbi:Wzz/FepE/Etk N-terminal domain-containing protein [Natroniella sulfidigena]|uniref:YveK family protein n=1 Tax=Natroniella sulfidigena TaxID=723921 RepID=UPI00200AD617|nr:Wzz/FepE/Etk N-terminal domain-containing protein [Natroniella sulfidigena]MCK8816310.1 Wzz/FepE/Etk N-terminal domain-containing protein [Natroniella sulfidigena]
MDSRHEYEADMVEIDLREYIEVLLQRKKMILGVFLVAVLISAVISFFMLEPIYQTEATISLSNQAGSYSESDNARQMLRSLEYFDRINRKFELGLTQNQLNSLRNNLEIDITEVGLNNAQKLEGDNLSLYMFRGGILDLSLQSKEPQQAKSIFDGLIELFEMESKQRFEENQDRIESNLQEVEGRIAELEREIQEREERIGMLLEAEDLSTTEKVILSNDFSGRMRDLEEVKLSLFEQKYEIQEELGDMEEMRVLNQPFVPDDPVAPNKKLNLAIAGVLGLMLGVFVAFAKEFWDDSI